MAGCWMRMRLMPQTSWSTPIVTAAFGLLAVFAAATGVAPRAANAGAVAYAAIDTAGVSAGAAPVPALAEPVMGGDVAGAIAGVLAGGRTTLEAGLAPDPHPLPLEPVLAFYGERGFTPVWVDDRGLRARTAALFAAFLRSGDDGLDPDDYLPPFILETRLSSAYDRARADVMLSVALLRYARDLRLGRLEPARMDTDGLVPHKAFDGAAVLTGAADAEDLGAYLATLVPSNPLYAGLRRSLREYRARAITGGWPAPAPERLEPGASGEAVALLRTILRRTGDLIDGPTTVAEPSLFDDALVTAVKSFQARHGLDPDGVVGTETRAAMAVPVEERINQILLNMERVRWLPDDLGDPHVFVNLAGFTLNYVVGGAGVLEMRAVVGTPERSSPEFSGEITYLEINPTWTVPRIIAVEDLLPKIRKDPHFLDANGFTLLGRSGGAVDSANVDWAEVTGDTFPYWLRQKPGPRNALGRIKFMLPNSFDVYLHDTPSRGLFSRPMRAYSSGCVRLENPLDLAFKLLEANGSWTRERLSDLVASGETQVISLRRPVPVHLAYLTAWRGADGTANFRNDIYGRDHALEAAFVARKVDLARVDGEKTAALP
jgi:murein L,D-transpeptidase YcbB/YkuD